MKTAPTNECSADMERRHSAAKTSCAAAEIIGEFERRIDFLPGYDHRSFPEACGGGGHGQHGMDMTWYLVGPKGIVQWKVFLSSMVPGRVDSIGSISGNGYCDVSAADLGYHSPVSMYEGQEPFDCDLLAGGSCYYDGSGLQAGPVLEDFVAHGPAPVWETLMTRYISLFGE